MEKTRYRIKHEGAIWEVDECHGVNDGLVVAEIELHDEEEIIARPDWIGREITTDFRYSNSALSEQPFREWSADAKSRPP